jgi:biopolymer transport protein TolQ
MMQVTPPDPNAGIPHQSPLEQVMHGSWPVVAIFLLILAMGTLGALIALLKTLQIWRMRAELHQFERESFNANESGDLFEIARKHAGSPGGRVVLAIAKRGGSVGILEAVAKRAIVAEQQRASSLMSMLGSVAAAAPFVGLLGTVYGIMEAFIKIGQEKSASLPVVAPAIGEALITTLFGLFAAIPALITYNLIGRWVENLVSELEAASGAWVTIVADSDRVSAHGAAPRAGHGEARTESQRPQYPQQY